MRAVRFRRFAGAQRQRDRHSAKDERKGVGGGGKTALLSQLGGAKPRHQPFGYRGRTGARYFQRVFRGSVQRNSAQDGRRGVRRAAVQRRRHGETGRALFAAVRRARCGRADRRTRRGNAGRKKRRKVRRVVGGD